MIDVLWPLTVKDETPFRYAHAETQMVVICGPTLVKPETYVREAVTPSIEKQVNPVKHPTDTDDNRIRNSGGA